jgi:arginyl-tRNA synthetase
MTIAALVRDKVSQSLQQLFHQEFTDKDFQISQTKPEFEGDYTVVLFSLIKSLRKSPDELGNALGTHLINQYADTFTAYNVIKGFLNLTIAESFWFTVLEENYANNNYGIKSPKGHKVMVEYSSPNTNKPLHLGHLRNNFLGWSIAEILKATGCEVIKTCIVNDRGIHICKSMIAWQRYGNGATPESEKQKGDHFVGDYYVKFNDEYKKEVEALIAAGKSKDEAEKSAPIMLATQEMLKKWEDGDEETLQLWRMMNSWVYKGFDETYKKIGSDFDKTYYESETYLLGKDIVQLGLEKGVFYKKEDGSVWIDLTADGLDEKLVLRKDGTSVYMTQDIGLAKNKYDEYGIDESIYVIGDEQNYHMKVLKLICQKLGLPYANAIYHLSYGMVELPTGKMKSREGTVVDADDIVQEMMDIAAKHTAELGKVQDFDTDALNKLYETIGLGALKFFLLRVDPKKKMIFNPEESVDFHGFTGPFIQYTHARIKSILRKEPIDTTASGYDAEPLLPLEKSLLIAIEQFQSIITQAADEHNPSGIAIYIFNLAKTFNSFYAEHSVTNAETPAKKQLRLRIAALTAVVIARGMSLLGIGVPEKM